jgi:hypothetical protein
VYDDDRPIERRPVRNLFPEVEPRVASESPSGEGKAKEMEAQEPVDVDAALRDLAAAREAGDVEAFHLAIAALSRADDPRAERRLLDLMAETNLSLPHPIGTRIMTGLRRSTLPGIAAAARARFEANLVAGETSWTAAEGWLDLVANHGSEADLDWLLEQGQSPQIRSEAREALALSDNPLAIARCESMLTRDPDDLELLQQFASRHPRRVLPFLEKRLREVADGFTGSLYGNTVPPEAVERARTVLLSARGPLARLAAAQAVDRMVSRGLDVSGLESLLLAPVEILERPGSFHEPGPPLRRAVNTLARCESAWSERALTAVMSLSRRLGPTDDLAAALRALEKKMRAKLREPWRDR